MKLRSLMFIFALALCVNAQSAELPLEHFIQHGDYINIQISPDGEHYAAQVRVDGQVVLVFIRSKDRKALGGVKPGSNDEIHSVTWVNKERVVYEVAKLTHWLDRPVPTGELLAVNIDTSQSKLIFGFRASNATTGSKIKTSENTYAHQEVLDILGDDRKHILIAEFPWETAGTAWSYLGDTNTIVSKLNVYNGRKKKLFSIPMPGAMPLADANGVVRFAYWVDEAFELHSSLRDVKSGEWREIATEYGLDDKLVPIAVAGNEAYLARGRFTDATESIVRLNISSGQITPFMESSQGFVNDWMFDNKSGVPVVAVFRHGAAEYRYADTPSLISEAHRKLAKAFPGRDVTITSATTDGESMVVKVSSDTVPGEFYHFSPKTGRAEFLFANRSWIDPEQMRPTRHVEIVARDEQNLHGYLTMPAMADAKQAALVVLVHGGPHGVRDYRQFDSEVQLLANRGYAVLQVNYRGSGGFGVEFAEKGYRQWGGAIIDDIVDATHWATDRDDIDASRVCIFGASFGGYAALMASAKSPDTFQCAIGYAGIYDLNLMYSKGDIPDFWGGVGYLEKVIGRDEEALSAYSPVNHVDAIKAEVMLIHGDEDWRAPIAHATKMRKALEDAGRNVTWLKYGHSGHGVWNIDDQRELYTGILEFLDAHTQ